MASGFIDETYKESQRRYYKIPEHIPDEQIMRYVKQTEQNKLYNYYSLVKE